MLVVWVRYQPGLPGGLPGLLIDTRPWVRGCFAPPVDVCAPTRSLPLPLLPTGYEFLNPPRSAKIDPRQQTNLAGIACTASPFYMGVACQGQLGLGLQLGLGDEKQHPSPQPDPRPKTSPVWLAHLLVSSGCFCHSSSKSSALISLRIL